jgi:hypothetical protein
MSGDDSEACTTQGGSGEVDLGTQSSSLSQNPQARAVFDFELAGRAVLKTSVDGDGDLALGLDNLASDILTDIGKVVYFHGAGLLAAVALKDAMKSFRARLVDVANENYDTYSELVSRLRLYMLNAVDRAAAGTAEGSLGGGELPQQSTQEPLQPTPSTAGSSQAGSEVASQGRKRRRRLSVTGAELEVALNADETARVERFIHALRQHVGCECKVVSRCPLFLTLMLCDSKRLCCVPAAVRTKNEEGTRR